MIDFINIWELINDLLDKHEITNFDDALDNDAFLDDINTLENAYSKMVINGVLTEIRDIALKLDTKEEL